MKDFVISANEIQALAKNVPGARERLRALFPGAFPEFKAGTKVHMCGGSAVYLVIHPATAKHLRLGYPSIRPTDFVLIGLLDGLCYSATYEQLSEVK